MSDLRWVINIWRVLFIASLPALFISLTLALAFNNLKLYEYSFDQYNVSQVAGISRSDLDRSASSLIHYFNSSNEFAQILVTQNGEQTQLLTPDEQLHFRDVKGLVRLDYKVLLASFLVALSFALWALFRRRGDYRRALCRATLWGSGLTLVIIIVLGVASFFDFEGLFLQFHYLAFNNDYWFAPGNMTLLFPEQFWYTAALICVAFIAFLAVMSGAVAAVLLRRKSR
jgi:integral membrane protein (TIGR01906 family)